MKEYIFYVSNDIIIIGGIYMNRIELKEKAKDSLDGKYGDAIGVVLLLFAISSIASGFIIALKDVFHLTETNFIILSEVISIIISGLFTFGYNSYFLKLSRDEDVEVNELWSKLNFIIPYIAVTILIALFTTLWTLLFIIPGIIAAFGYSMAYYVMLDHPEMSAMEAIKESKRIMNGHKWDYFILQFSFLGWAILGIFTLGILWVWLIPYMNVTICNFYNEIKDL